MRWKVGIRGGNLIGTTKEGATVNALMVNLDYSSSQSLPPVYFDILETMTHLQGRDVSDLATKRLMQIIIEDVIFDDGYYGEMISKSWKEDLKGDEYFKDVCG